VVSPSAVRRPLGGRGEHRALAVRALRRAGEPAARAPHGGVDARAPSGGTRASRIRSRRFRAHARGSRRALFGISGAVRSARREPHGERAMSWSESDIPDLDHRVAVVTGANSGIGFETARALAAKGARVILGCRSRTKGPEATARIRDAVPGADV